MNFVGHAHVALAARTETRFVLGAMLPDFASMGRARLERVDDPEIAAGVALHHRTDDAFHGCPSFAALSSETTDILEARGLPWGASRAVGHVGVELLLDGLILADRGTRDAAARAARLLAEPATIAAIRVHASGTERWSQLLARVAGRGLPDFYGDPIAVADRLILILASRPRLAIPEDHRGILRDEMVALRPKVEACAPAMLASALRALDDRAFAR